MFAIKQIQHLCMCTHRYNTCACVHKYTKHVYAFTQIEHMRIRTHKYNTRVCAHTVTTHVFLCIHSYNTCKSALTDPKTNKRKRRYNTCVCAHQVQHMCSAHTDTTHVYPHTQIQHMCLNTYNNNTRVYAHAHTTHVCACVCTLEFTVWNCVQNCWGSKICHVWLQANIKYWFSRAKPAKWTLIVALTWGDDKWAPFDGYADACSPYRGIIPHMLALMWFYSLWVTFIYTHTNNTGEPS